MVSTHDSAKAKKRILIMDDDPSVRHMLARILEDEGYATTSAADGLAGLKLLQEGDVDLVLMDLKMPGMNGEDTLKELKVMRPGLPIIVMTAFSNEKFKDSRAGVGALLQKPLDFPTLLATIEKLLTQSAACM